MDVIGSKGVANGREGDWVTDPNIERWVVAANGAALLSADEDGTLGFVPGLSRPWGRVAGYNGKSKYKSIK